MPGSQLTKVPEGLRDLIKGLTKEVLREKPLDLYEFAAQYFESLIRERKDFKVKEFESISEYDYFKSRGERNAFPAALIYSIIPVALTELIKDFIKAVLRQRPENICAFAVEYFRNLKKIKTNETSRTDYLAFENYFKGREKFSFTPYVKCTCGRTLAGMSSIYKNEHEKSDGNLVDHTNCMPNKQLKTELNGNSKSVGEEHANFKQKSQLVFDEKTIRAVYVIQKFFRHYIIKKKTAHKRNFQENSEPLRFEEKEEKHVLHQNKDQQNSVSDILETNTKNIVKNEDSNLSIEDKAKKLDLTEDLNKKLINNNSSQSAKNILTNDLNEAQILAMPENKLLIEPSNDSKDEKLKEIVTQKFDEKSTEIEPNKVAEKTEIIDKNQHITDETIKEDQNSLQVIQTIATAVENITPNKKELKNEDDFPELKMSDEKSKLSNEIMVENKKETESKENAEVKKICITAENACEQNFRDNLKDNREDATIKNKSVEEKGGDKEIKTFNDMKTGEKISNTSETKEIVIDNEIKNQSNVLATMPIEKDISKETIKKTATTAVNELIKVSSDVLGESLNTNNSTNIKSTEKTEIQNMHTEQEHKENEKVSDSVNVSKDNAIVEKLIEAEIQEASKINSNLEGSDENLKEEKIQQSLPETKSVDLKVDASNQEENILINTPKSSSDMRNIIGIKDINEDQNETVSEDAETKETKSSTEKTPDRKENFDLESKSSTEKENEEISTYTDNNMATAADYKAKEASLQKEVIKNEAKDELKELTKNSIENIISPNMNTYLEKLVHSASAEDPKLENLEAMSPGVHFMQLKEDLSVETATKKDETDVKNLKEVLVTEHPKNLVRKNEISKGSESLKQENESKDRSNNLKFEEKLNKNENQKQVDEVEKTVNHKEVVKSNTLLSTEESSQSLEKSYADKIPNENPNESLEINTQTKEKIMATRNDDKAKKVDQTDKHDENQKILMDTRVQQLDSQQLGSADKKLESKLQNEETNSPEIDNSLTLTVQHNKDLTKLTPDQTKAEISPAVTVEDNTKNIEENSNTEENTNTTEEALTETHKKTTNSEKILEADLKDKNKESHSQEVSATEVEVAEDQKEAKDTPAPFSKESSKEIINVEASTAMRATKNAEEIVAQDLHDQEKDTNLKEDVATLNILNKQSQNKAREAQTKAEIAATPSVEEVTKEILTENQNDFENSNKIIDQNLHYDKNNTRFKDDLAPLTIIAKPKHSKEAEEQTEAKVSPTSSIQEVSKENVSVHEDVISSGEIQKRDLKLQNKESSLKDAPAPDEKEQMKVTADHGKDEVSTSPTVEEKSKDTPTTTNALPANPSEIKDTNEILDQVKKDLKVEKQNSNTENEKATLKIINKENQSKELAELTEVNNSQSQAVEELKENTNTKASTINSDNQSVNKNVNETLEQDIQVEKKDDLDPLKIVNKQIENVALTADQIENEALPLSSIEEASKENMKTEASKATNAFSRSQRDIKSSDEFLERDLKDEKHNRDLKDDSATVVLLNKQSKEKERENQLAEDKDLSISTVEENGNQVSKHIKSRELSTTKQNSVDLTSKDNEPVLVRSKQVNEKHAITEDETASVSSQNMKSPEKISEKLTDAKVSPDLTLDDVNAKLKINNNNFKKELENMKDLDDKTVENKTKENLATSSFESKECTNKITGDLTKSEAYGDNNTNTSEDILNKESSLKKIMLSSNEKPDEILNEEKIARAKENLASISIENKNINKITDDHTKFEDLQNSVGNLESNNQSNEKVVDVKDDLVAISAENYESANKMKDDQNKSKDLHSKSVEENNNNDTAKEVLSKEISKINNEFGNIENPDEEHEKNTNAKVDLANELVENNESSNKLTDVQNKSEVLSAQPADSDNSHKILSNEVSKDTTENNEKDNETKTKVLETLTSDNDLKNNSSTVPNEVFSISAVATTNNQTNLKDPAEILESKNQVELKDSNHNDKSIPLLMQKNESPKKITANQTKPEAIPTPSVNEDTNIDAIKDISSNETLSLKDSEESLENNTSNAKLSENPENAQEKLKSEEIPKISTDDNESDVLKISTVNEQLPEDSQKQITEHGPMNNETVNFKKETITNKETSQESLNNEVVIVKQTALKANEFPNKPINQVKKTTKDQQIEKENLRKGRTEKTDIIKAEKLKMNTNDNKKVKTQKSKTISSENLDKTSQNNASLHTNNENNKKNETSIENEENDLNNKNQHKKPTRLCQTEGVKNEFIEQKYIQYPIAEIYLKSFKVPSGDNTIIQDVNKMNTSNTAIQKSHNNSISSEVSYQENETEFSDSLNDENFERDSLEVGSSKETDIEEDSIEIEKQQKLNDEINKNQQLNLATERMPTYLYGIQTVEESKNTQEKPEKPKKAIAFVIPFENDNNKVKAHNKKDLNMTEPNVSVEKALIDNSNQETSVDIAIEDEENITLRENSPEESRLQTIFEQNEFDSPRQEETAENKLGDFIFPVANEVYNSKENLIKNIALENETASVKINETIMEKQLATNEEPLDSFNDISSLSDNDCSESSTFTTSKEYDETVLSDEIYNLKENVDNFKSILKNEKLNKIADTTPKGGIYELDTKNLSLMLSNENEKLQENASKPEFESEIEKEISDEKAQVQNQNIIKETENFLKTEKYAQVNFQAAVTKKEDLEIVPEDIKTQTESLAALLKDNNKFENIAIVNTKSDLEPEIEKIISDAKTEVQQLIQDQNQNILKETEKFLKIERSAQAHFQETTAKKEDFANMLDEIKTETENLTPLLKDVKKLENTETTIKTKSKFHKPQSEVGLSYVETKVSPLLEEHKSEDTTNKDEVKSGLDSKEKDKQNDNKNDFKNSTVPELKANYEEIPKDQIVDVEKNSLLQVLKDVQSTKNVYETMHREIPMEKESLNELFSNVKELESKETDINKESTIPEQVATVEQNINESLKLEKDSFVPEPITSAGENKNESLKLEKAILKEVLETAKSMDVIKEIKTENISNVELSNLENGKEKLTSKTSFGNLTNGTKSVPTDVVKTETIKLDHDQTENKRTKREKPTILGTLVTDEATKTDDLNDENFLSNQIEVDTITSKNIEHEVINQGDYQDKDENNFDQSCDESLTTVIENEDFKKDISNSSSQNISLEFKEHENLTSVIKNDDLKKEINNSASQKLPLELRGDESLTTVIEYDDLKKEWNNSSSQNISVEGNSTAMIKNDDLKKELNNSASQNITLEFKEDESLTTVIENDHLKKKFNNSVSQNIPLQFKTDESITTTIENDNLKKELSNFANENVPLQFKESESFTAVIKNDDLKKETNFSASPKLPLKFRNEESLTSVMENDNLKIELNNSLNQNKTLKFKADESLTNVVENDDVLKKEFNNSSNSNMPLENKVDEKLTAEEIEINKMLQQLPTPPQHDPSSNSFVNEITNLTFSNEQNNKIEKKKNEAALLIQTFFKNYLTKKLNEKENEKIKHQQDSKETTSTSIMENNKVNWFVGEEPIISKNILTQQTNLETIGTLEKHQEQNFEHAPQVYTTNIGLETTNDVLVNQLISQEKIVSAEMKPESGQSTKSNEVSKDTAESTVEHFNYDKKTDPTNEYGLNEVNKIILPEIQQTNIEKLETEKNKVKENKFCKIESTKAFLQKEIEFTSFGGHAEVIEEPCIKRTFSENVINEIEAETENEAGSITQDNADELNNEIVIAAAERKLQKPEQFIEKMQRRRSLEIDSSANKVEQSFDNASFDEPVIKTLESIVDSRNSSAEDTDEVVIISPAKQINEPLVYLKRLHTIAVDDTSTLFKSVTIDETINYIELKEESETTTTTTSIDSFCLDEDTSENIRKKMMAYSLSEADSDLFNPKVDNYSLNSFDVAQNNDFDINTALKKSETTSTETESTIVSAATKIQAGARGFLTRRRLHRASAGSKSQFYDGTKDSFGNNAISESLETMVENEAARKIQKAFRNHRQNQFQSIERTAGNISHESSLAAKRLTLQRGDAVRNNSSPEEDNSNTENLKTENNANSKPSESDYKEKEKNFIGILTKYKTDQNTKSNELKWIKFRQNSMPVQIDLEIFRVIPKPRRKETNSAGESKKYARRSLHE